jgi:hypothetical protein
MTRARVHRSCACIAVIEAADEIEAQRLMEEDPAIASGFARCELRPFRVSLLRGRD